MLPLVLATLLVGASACSGTSSDEARRRRAWHRTHDHHHGTSPGVDDLDAAPTSFDHDIRPHHHDDDVGWSVAH